MSTNGKRDAKEPPPSTAPMPVQEGLPRYGQIGPLEETRTIRIGFLNIRSFPYNESTKLHELHEMISQHQLRIIGLSELNTNWHHIPIYQRPYNTFQKLFGTANMTIAHNQHVSFRQKYVNGGTFLTTIGQNSSRIISAGHDPTGLGR
jgi:hypothetical protein